jgi:hypothetical protein
MKPRISPLALFHDGYSSKSLPKLMRIGTLQPPDYLIGGLAGNPIPLRVARGDTLLPLVE